MPPEVAKKKGGQRKGNNNAGPLGTVRAGCPIFDLGDKQNQKDLSQLNGNTKRRE